MWITKGFYVIFKLEYPQSTARKGTRQSLVGTTQQFSYGGEIGGYHQILLKNYDTVLYR
jgi:hypothetical protein